MKRWSRLLSMMFIEDLIQALPKCFYGQDSLEVPNVEYTYLHKTPPLTLV